MCRTLLRRAPMYYEGPVVRWDNGLCDTEQGQENMTGLTTFNMNPTYRGDEGQGPIDMRKEMTWSQNET